MPQAVQAGATKVQATIGASRPHVLVVKIKTKMLPPGLNGQLKVFPGDSPTEQLPKRGYKALRRLLHGLQPENGIAFVIFEDKKASCKISIHLEATLTPRITLNRVQECIDRVPWFSVSLDSSTLWGLEASLS